MPRSLHFNRLPVLLLSLCLLTASGLFAQQDTSRPNVILMMADDLGYGDTGFNGNELIQTPHMDKMAADGALLRHFYAGGPVCSPTRGTVLTGRHYFRYGIFGANVGHLPAEEITVARLLKSKGYATGHFGKWHLGTLSKTYSSKGESRQPALNFAPPWERDYDESFVVESSVSTWNPASPKNPFYLNGTPMPAADESLLGGAARVVVDRAIPFMETAVQSNTPFLSVVWFNAPHEPIEAGPEYLAMYPDAGDAAHYYGCITEMDDQVGRIRAKLEEWGVAENTVIFFCSDNGPEGKQVQGRKAGVTADLRGRKRSLYDGGVRVPAYAYWPGQIKAGSVINTPLSTLDYLPTLAGLVDYAMPDARPIDGVDMLPILQQQEASRAKAIPFRHRSNGTIVQGHYKLILPKGELYDLNADWSEATNIADQHPERVAAMTKELEGYLASMEQSHAGADYGAEGFTPLGEFQQLKISKGKKIRK